MKRLFLLPLFGLLVLACDQAVDEGNPDGGESLVAVHYDDQTEAVDLMQLATVEVGGDELVPLTAVVQEAFPSAGSVEADFEAADGFRPAAKSDCLPLIPVPNDLLASGYLDPLTRNLIWDEALGYGGCMHPKDVAIIRLSDGGAQGALLTLTLDDFQVEVDLGFQPTETVGEEQLVPLQTVISASGVASSPNLYDYDFEGADGFRPTLDKDAAPLTWDEVGSGHIHPQTRDLTFDESAGISGYWGVNDTATIHLIVTEVSPRRVALVYGSLETEVDLGELDTVEVEGEHLVNLQALVEAAGLSADATGLLFDMQGSDGFRPSVDRDTDPLTWEQIGQGYIHPASGDLTWDAALGLPGFWSVSDVVRIHLLDP